MQHHQLRLTWWQLLVVQSPFAQGQRPGVGHHHIALGGQLTQELRTVGTQVDGDRPFVATDAFPHQADAVALDAPAADGVAALRLLHLMTSAPNSLSGGRQRCGGQRRHVQHPDPREHVAAGRGCRVLRHRRPRGPIRLCRGLGGGVVKRLAGRSRPPGSRAGVAGVVGTHQPAVPVVPAPPVG